MSLHEQTYKPYGSPSFKNSDEIRIAVNFQDLILDISESYIYIEGKFTPNDATKTCYLSNNALAFLFDEIRYEMGGEQVCMVRKPGITTTMKSMISYGESNMKFLETIGWGLDGGKQVLLDKASNVFSGKLPLKYLMGFAEDYCRGILNIKQELILIIARSFKNSYIGEVDADVEINKIEWKIRHVMPSDKQKLKLLTRLNRSSTAKVKIAYRMWDLYELPTIRETASDIWAVKTTNSLERPRYIIIGFQNTDNTDNRSEDITQFTHAGVSNIRLYLNSEVYPYERWNLDFDKKLDAVAYYAYDNFQRSYYGKDMSEPMMSIEEFRKNPLFIIDCNHQPDAMKSSTVDINGNTALQSLEDLIMNSVIHRYCMKIHGRLPWRSYCEDALSLGHIPTVITESRFTTTGFITSHGLDSPCYQPPTATPANVGLGGGPFLASMNASGSGYAAKLRQEAIATPQSAGNPFMMHQDMPSPYPPHHQPSPPLSIPSPHMMDQQHRHTPHPLHQLTAISMPMTPPHSNSNMSMTPPHSNENMPPDGWTKVASEDGGFGEPKLGESGQPLAENNGGFLGLYGGEQQVDGSDQQHKQRVAPPQPSHPPQPPAAPAPAKRPPTKPLPDFNEAFGSTERGRFQSPPDPRLGPNKGGYLDLFYGDGCPPAVKFEDFQL
ncbi:unnamed protein product [Phaedon cochleariae]|uniref:Double jelly roll-like domain-containing protein n=1 Tax=Phaedon cochleariae TaxID=80249 RepID=A0A9N9S9G9_PHACE|nr:unnamed protein product [Phaedon cochleariae]